MYYYSIGDVGIKFDTNKKINSSKKFKLFEINKEKFDLLKRKVVFSIKNDKLPKIDNCKKMGSGFEYFLQKEKNKTIRFLQKEENEPYCCYIAYKNGQKEIRIEDKYEYLMSDIEDYFKAIDVVSIFCRHNALILHSSFINYKNVGIIFSGPSGIGKSTQADLWNKYEKTDIINGDRSLIKKINHKWYAYGFPYSGSSNYCLNEVLEIKLIVILEQGKQNNLVQLSNIEKFKYIYSQISVNKWDKDLNTKIIDLVTDLVSNVSIIKLSCLPNENAVKILKLFIEGEILI